MAVDNVTLPGTSEVIATDLAGSAQYQVVKLADGAADSTARIGGDATNGLDVDVTRLPALVAGSANIGDVDILSIAAGNNNIGDVDIASIAAGDNNIGNVDIVTLPALVASTAAIGKLAANSGVDIGDVDVTSIVMPTGASAAQVQGTVAHDATAANNPVLNGAEALSAERAVVQTTDVVKLVADLVGKLIVLPYANPENFLSGKTAAITDTTRTQVIAAQAAGVRIFVTHILVTNSHATVGTVVNVEDGTATIYTGYAAPAGGGFSITLPTPLRGTAATALNVSCGTTGSNIYVSASGYKGV